MGKIIVLISSKGGCGKSTVAVMLSTAFSLAGKSVLVIDADEGARCLDTLLSIDNQTVFDLSDVLTKEIETEKALISVPTLQNVSVIPSPLNSELIDFAKFSEYLKEIANGYDYVIVDTKGQQAAERIAGLPKEATFVAVVTPDEIAIKNTGVLSAWLSKHDISCRLLVNRFKKKGRNKKYNNVDNIIDTCGARLLGIVPEDESIGVNSTGPIAFGIAAKAINRIAARLDGEKVPLPAINKILK